MVNFVVFGSGMCPSSQSPTNKPEDKNLQPLEKCLYLGLVGDFLKAVRRKFCLFIASGYVSLKAHVGKGQSWIEAHFCDWIALVTWSDTQGILRFCVQNMNHREQKAAW